MVLIYDPTMHVHVICMCLRIQLEKVKTYHPYLSSLPYPIYAATFYVISYAYFHVSFYLLINLHRCDLHEKCGNFSLFHIILLYVSVLYVWKYFVLRIYI